MFALERKGQVESSICFFAMVGHAGASQMRPFRLDYVLLQQYNLKNKQNHHSTYINDPIEQNQPTNIRVSTHLTSLFSPMIIIIFDMEGEKLPSLQKSTSVDANIPEKENRITISLHHKYKVGSFPQLPQQGTPTFNRGLLITKKLSCSQRYQEQLDDMDPNILYARVLSLIKEMISNPSKFQILLSALHSMEGSVRNGRMKDSLDFTSSRHRRNLTNKLSQGSIKFAKETTQKLANSLKLSQQSEDVGEKSKPSYQICDFMAQSIEIQLPFESMPATNEKGSLDQDQDFMISHLSASKSIQEEMLDSLHLPQFTDMYKKISLLLVEESEGNGSDLCSSTSSTPPTFPILPFNLELVIAVFGDASPLLMNLALSLLFKFMYRSKTKLSLQNAGMLLSLSALVGYKIFYDQTLQGILEYFSGVLNVQNDETVRLERWFLGELNYEVLINNKHYTEIMMKLMSNQ